MTFTSDITPTELYHLAIKATSEGDRERSMSLLKRFLACVPSDASQLGHAHYLLGAEYADIRMLDEALTHMQEAVTFTPNLYVAHFQIGLLYSLGGQAEQAKAAWQPILQRDQEQDALSYYVTALIAINDNDADNAISNLETGLRMANDNPPLYQDMQNLLIKTQDKIDAAKANEDTSNTSEIDTTTTEKTKADQQDASSNRHLLSRYQSND